MRPDRGVATLVAEPRESDATPPVPSSSRRSRSPRAWFARRDVGGPRRVPWIVALPAVFLLVAFHLIPVAWGGYHAFTEWNGITPSRWIGLDNFREIFDTPATSGAFKHTLQLAVAFFVLVNVIGLGLALALNRTLKSRHLLRSLFFLPVVISPLAVSYVWQYVLSSDGALNSLLGTLGLESWQHAWLAEPGTALWTILVVLVWQYSGLCMVLYLAGLQGVPEELLEAAAVDGASPWTRFRRITLPLLAPAITIATTLMAIFSLRVFDQVIALTDGGPAGASETLATQVYKQTFANGRYGYGAALALLLTALVAVVAIAQMLLARRREAKI